METIEGKYRDLNEKRVSDGKVALLGITLRPGPL